MLRIPRSHWAMPFLAFGALAIAGCDDDDDTTGPDGGTLEVTVTATGAPADPDGFTILVDGTQEGAIVPATGTTTPRSIALDAGTYELELGSLAANCTVAGDNPRDVTITNDQTTEVTFDVTCAAAGNTLTISTATTGTNPDADGYTISVNGGTPEAVDANGTFDVTGLAAGDVEVLLEGIAANCAVTGDNPATVTVVDGTPAELDFAVTCAAATGNATVTTTTTGANIDPDGFTIAVDGGTPELIGVNETVTVWSLGEGDVDFVLGGVAANCTVQEGTTQTIPVTDQQTSEVTFTVTCT